MIRRTLVVTALVVCLTPVAWADSMLTSSNDPFDSTNGTIILDHDTIVDPINLFRTSGGFEDGHTLMRNGGLNSVSFVNFRTAAPVAITGVRLTAMMEFFSGLGARRALNRFRLLADVDNNGTFETLLVDEPITVPYSNEPCNITGTNFLDRHFSFPLTTSRDWRIEITQGSDLQPFEGARVIEVDALTSFADAAISSSGPTSVVAGTNVVYTSNVTNLGPSTATPVIVNHAAPPGLTFVSNTGNCTTAFPCNLGAISVGATRTITTTYFVPSSYVGSINSTFTLDQSLGNPGCTSLAANDTSTVATLVTQSADLSITKTGPAAVIPSQSLVYTVTVTNNGPSDAQSVLVEDPTPSGLTFVSNSGDCASAYPCDFGTVVAGVSRTITTTYSVPADYATPNPLLNTATVTSSTTDPNAANDSATSSLPVVPHADIEITKTGDAAGVAGQTAAYTITVTNHGPSVASVVVSDPDTFSLSLVQNSGACVTAFPCTLPAMQVNETRIIDSLFLISPSAGVSATNTATVSIPGGVDPNPANDSASATTQLEAISNLVLLVSGPQLAGGDSVPLSITVRNDGPSTATGVVIEMPTPVGLTLVDAPAGCGDVFPCTLGGFDPGVEIRLDVRFVITGTTTSPLTITVTALAATDPDPSDNTVTYSADTCPSAITNMVPFEGAIHVPQTAALAWKAVNADAYDVYLGPAGTGCSSMVGTTTANFWSYANLVRRAEYEWKVVARKAGCPAGDVVSACQTFTSGPPCPTISPTTIFPPNGGLDFLSPIRFSWTAVEGADGYQVWASIDDTPPVVLGTTEGTSLVYDTSPGSLIWWVEAFFDDCPSLQSTQARFTASGACVARAARLLGPPNGEELSSPVTFEWEAVGGAQSYSVWVSVDGKFPIVVASTTVETEATVAVPSGSLRWYVQSRYQRCPPAISEIRTIEVPPRPECASNGTPALVRPFQGQSLLSPIEFEWTPVTGATGYTIWASVDGDSPSIIATTNGATRVEQDLRPGAVVWFVQANFEQCPSTESLQRTFTVIEPGSCDFDTPVPLAPSDGSSISSTLATFEWRESAGAVEYRVWGSLDGSAWQLLAAIPATRTSVDVALPIGRVDWYVDALFRACPTRTSTTSMFTIPESAGCGSRQFEAISPRGAVFGEEDEIFFIWEDVPGTVEYRLWLTAENGTRTLLATSATSTLGVSIEPGRYSWFVEAIRTGCSPEYSGPSTVNVTANPGCANRRPTPLAPVDGAAELTSPVTFVWTPVPDASSYRLFVTVEDAPTFVLETASTELTVPLPEGVAVWRVEARTSSCSRARSTESQFRVIALATCSLPAAPAASVVGEVTEGESYQLLWDRVAGTTIYEVQQTSRFNASMGIPDFSGETVFPTTNFLAYTAPPVAQGSDSLTLYYRVRGIADCSQQRGPYSTPVAVVVTRSNQSAQIGTLDLVVRDLTLCADESGRVFECAPGAPATNRRPASVDVNLLPSEPWLTVEPASGTIPPGGSLTVRVGADPTVLPAGTSTATLQVAAGAAGRTVAGSGGSVPVSVGLAAPVTPNPKTTPPPYAQIIPAVIHGDSATGTWRSDIRVLNTTARRQKYQLSFTPSEVDGTRQGKQATVEIGGGEVLAFDDVVRSWYGAAGGSLSGVLEVRPLSAPGGTSGTGDGSMITSSRTYNSTPFGSFGQYIPGVPFGRFVGKATGSALLLQHIAQSPRFRTNFGFVEAGGQPVELLLRIFDARGALLGQRSISLKAGQHTQLNSLLAQMGITVDDARAEVTVTSDTGRITAYASVVDAMTSDPTFVPASSADFATLRRVVPGIADLDTGRNRWRSDIRIFNPGGESVDATLTFYPQGAPGSATPVFVTLPPGEIAVLDDILRSLFGVNNVGGALHVQTPVESPLIVTGRTYDVRPDGTVGQFIPALDESQAASLGGRVLNILQVEESDRLRSNLGIAEVSGMPVEVEVAAVVPRSLSAPLMRISLAPNEFRQVNSVFRQLGFDQAFNGRLIVKVVGGEGRVVAYASSIDNATGDPAYIPAQ